MAPSTTVLGRPADRTNLIVNELRGQIVAGQLAPGSQLPTRLEIEESFGAGASTVQKALEYLRQDGFIIVNGRQGTFVAERPPHLTNYALIFPDLPEVDHAWKRFWVALLQEASGLAANRGLHIAPYFGITKGSDNPDYQRLVREVRNHRLAGLIFASSPFLVENTPVVEESGLARVAIMADANQHNCRAVNPDTNSFWERAFPELARRGCKKVAVLLPYGMEKICRRPLEESLREAGLETRPYWIQEVHLGAAAAATRLMHLLLSDNQRERPDSLVIADDNLLDAAGAGILSTGIRVPEQLKIVAHCNFPLRETSPLPLIRLGYDAYQVLETCLENLHTQDEAPLPNHVVPIPALFETEYRQLVRA